MLTYRWVRQQMGRSQCEVEYNRTGFKKRLRARHVQSVFVADICFEFVIATFWLTVRNCVVLYTRYLEKGRHVENLLYLIWVHYHQSTVSHRLLFSFLILVGLLQKVYRSWCTFGTPRISFQLMNIIIMQENYVQSIYPSSYIFLSISLYSKCSSVSHYMRIET